MVSTYVVLLGQYSKLEVKLLVQLIQTALLAHFCHSN
jgi:hypothetical protein